MVQCNKCFDTGLQVYDWNKIDIKTRMPWRRLTRAISFIPCECPLGNKQTRPKKFPCCRVPDTTTMFCLRKCPNAV